MSHVETINQEAEETFFMKAAEATSVSGMW